MGQMLILESFDTFDTFDTFDEPVTGTLCDGTAVTATMTADFVEGYDSGYANGLIAGQTEAEAAFEARQTALTQELVQVLADLSFSHAEARAHLTALLTPLFEAITGAVLPAMIRASLAPHIKDLLNAAAGADTAQPLTLSLHPDHVAPMQAVLEGMVAVPFMIRPDDDLGRGSALIRAGGSGTRLDLDAVQAAIEGALSAILTNETLEQEGHSHHG